MRREQLQLSWDGRETARYLRTGVILAEYSNEY